MTVDDVDVRDGAVAADRVVAAPADVLFDLVADPRMHPRIDGSGTLRDRVRGPDRLAEGARFGMGMRQLGVPYVTPNLVVEFEDGRRIAWRHPGRHRWRWEFEPLAPARTLVRHTYAYGHSPVPRLLELLGFVDAAAEGMPRSLANLERLAAERTAEDDGDVTG